MGDIGIVALQGDVREHARILDALGASTREVRVPTDLEGLDGLVLPGGESTTMARLAERFGMVEPLRETIAAGVPTFGTCAGMIFLAAGVSEGSQLQLGVLDITVRRNAFGRQNDSFESNLRIEGLDDPFHAVFIRGPWVERVGAKVQVMAEVEGHPVLVREGSIVAASFHPELTADTRVHRMALNLMGAG